MKRFHTYFLALAALSLLTVAAAPSALEKRSPEGTARVFKRFGLAFRNLGRKIDHAVSEDR